MVFAVLLSTLQAKIFFFVFLPLHTWYPDTINIMPSIIFTSGEVALINLSIYSFAKFQIHYFYENINIMKNFL